MTRVGIDPWECDVFFPAEKDWGQGWEVVEVSETKVYKDIPYDFIEYRKTEGRSSGFLRLLT